MPYSHAVRIWVLSGIDNNVFILWCFQCLLFHIIIVLLLLFIRVHLLDTFLSIIPILKQYSPTSFHKLFPYICSSYKAGIFDYFLLFRQNQIMFCMHPWIVEDFRHIYFNEYRVRERCRLPATFYDKYR